MNKLIIFDLDGVLVESKEWHFYSLNDALEKVDPKYMISYDEHLSTYDGLNTTKKLKILTQNKGLDPKYYDQVWQDKQTATFEILKTIKPNQKNISIFKELRSRGYKIAVASNSIRESLKLMILNMGLMEYTDLCISNEDVSRTKPYPEMYWKCMTLLNALPKNTIIIEDSHLGRQGALDSGAHLLAIENVDDLSLSKILRKIGEVENMDHKDVPWIDNKLNVLIPMAGRGSRFEQAGYTFPKPLIDVRGKPMIKMVVDNLNIQANYIFLVLKEHIEKYNVDYMLRLMVPNCKIVVVDQVTEGSACTVLLAKDLIDNDNPLLMANSDQFLVWNSNEILYAFKNDSIDGGMVTFENSSPKWSFAKLDEKGFISEVAEKRPISDHANTGVMYYRKGSDFVKYAEQMIEKNIRVNGEFYTTPVMNEAIADGKLFKIKHIEQFWGTGTPEDLDSFLRDYKGKV
jgi:HAD superfamily hydrolase (TIGR01509 family)